MFFGRRYSQFCCGFAAVAMAGCTRPPPLPEFPSRPDPVSRILLDDRITARDIREIFRAVNRSGMLDALKPFIEEPDDLTLDAIAGLLTRRAYEDARLDRGLLALVRSRMAAGDFARFLSWAVEWRASPGFSSEREAFFSLISSEDLPRVARTAGTLLDTGWHATAVAATREAQAVALPKHALDLPGLAREWALFLALPEERSRLARTSASLWRYGGPSSLAASLGDARTQTEDRPFVGLALSLQSLARVEEDAAGKPSSELDSLLALTGWLDAPTNGLFLELQERLRDPRLASELATWLQPGLAGAASGFLGEGLAEAPGKRDWLALTTEDEAGAGARTRLFRRVLRALEAVLGPVLPEEPHRPHFTANLPLLVHAYSISEWVRHVARSSQPQWRELPEQGFAAAVWKLPLKAPALDLVLVEQHAPGRFRLVPARKAELARLSKALDSQIFVDTLDAVVQHEGFGSFAYAFPEVRGARPIRAELGDLVNECDRVRPLADVSPFWRAFFRLLAHPEEGGPLALGSWERPNLFVSLHRLAAGLPFSVWRSTLGWGLSVLGPEIQGEDTRRLILSFYDGHLRLREKAAGLLDTFGALAPLLRPPAPGLPPLLELYAGVVGHTAPRSMEWLHAGLAYVRESRLFSLGSEGRAVQPHTRAWLASGSPARLAAFLGAVPEGSAARLLLPLSELMGGSHPEGLLPLLSVAERTLRLAPDGAASALARWLADPPAWLADPGFVTSGERAWLRALMESQDLQLIHDIFLRHASRDRVRDFLGAMLDLARDGRLREAGTLLRQVRDERVQAIGGFLVEAEHGGQLALALEGMLALFR